MPKKLSISKELPENLQVKEVIGPLVARAFGNSVHVIFPMKYDGSKVYVIVINPDKPISEAQTNE